MRNVDAQDIDHYDALTCHKDRLFGLRCAIKGADIASSVDKDGLLQLTNDIAQSFKEMYRAFARERSIRTRAIEGD